MAKTVFVDETGSIDSAYLNTIVVNNQDDIISGNFTHTGEVRLASKTPASASDTGVTGTIAWDASYIYICIATDTWKRSGISTW